MKCIENKVIDNISLDIKKGDVLGVVGRNGSGKSTFLSLLARIMEPDSGTVKHSGKIASILELGMGFHGDMSGRENIYLKGEMYGFSRKEISKRIDEIIDYSGIGRYIDNPVRTYSSGMTGRLAFAIMINVDSDIMLVDEVLSVGDASFASKAREYFRKVSASGKTVVFVSHNLASLESMCNRAIWIEDGKIRKEGPVKEVCAEYQNMLNESPEIISDLADIGVPDSQYKLALMYRDGINYPVDTAAYEELIKKSAIQGHTKAQVEYGDILLKKGEVSDAFDFYNAAAKKGDYEAKIKVSSMSSSKDNIVELLSIYEQLAVPGDGLNEFRYADLILKTSWDKDSRKKAFDMFLKSANDGFPNAMHQIGVMYRDGIGVERNIEKMKDYLTKGAEMGYLPSITLLADIYNQGRLLPKDEKELFRWTLKACELGSSAHFFNLALMYRDGVGTPADIEESDRWFKRFYEAGLYWHKVWASDYVKTGGIITSKDTGDLYEDASSVNNNATVTSWSIYYKLLNNESIDCELKRMEFLANNNNIEAIKRLAGLYQSGIGVEKDPSEALIWYEKGAILGDPLCKLHLGEIYKDKEFDVYDIDKSIQWFSEAGKQGNVLALYNIIILFSNDTITDVHTYEKALDMLHSIANSGNLEAIKRLAGLYQSGIGVEKDPSEALKWYEKGAILGDPSCIQHVKTTIRQK